MQCDRWLCPENLSHGGVYEGTTSPRTPSGDLVQAGPPLAATGSITYIRRLMCLWQFFPAFLGRLDICDTGELLDDDDFDQTDASFTMRPFAHLSNTKLDKTVELLG